MVARTSSSAAMMAVGALAVMSVVVFSMLSGTETLRMPVQMRARTQPMVWRGRPVMKMQPNRPNMYRAHSSVADEEDVETFEKDLAELYNDIADGESLDDDPHVTPNSWAEYEDMVNKHGLPLDKETEMVDFASGATTVTPTYGLNVIWMEKNIALAVDEIFPGDKRIPLTNYHLWPQADAWEELKNLMEDRKHIAERDTITLLNQATEVINFWQESHTTKEAYGKFPEILIRGTEQVESSDSQSSEATSEVEDQAGALDYSDIPTIDITQAPGFDALLPDKAWFRDPTKEGPWDADSGVWKDVQIKTLEELHRAVPQKMPGQ